MERLKVIAVSPGVAIGEAMVVDNEGFRIPRRFLPRDAVEEELARLDGAMKASALPIQFSDRARPEPLPAARARGRRSARGAGGRKAAFADGVALPRGDGLGAVSGIVMKRRTPVLRPRRVVSHLAATYGWRIRALDLPRAHALTSWAVCHRHVRGP